MMQKLKFPCDLFLFFFVSVTLSIIVFINNQLYCSLFNIWLQIIDSMKNTRTFPPFVFEIYRRMYLMCVSVINYAAQ